MRNFVKYRRPHFCESVWGFATETVQLVSCVFSDNTGWHKNLSQHVLVATCTNTALNTGLLLTCSESVEKSFSTVHLLFISLGTPHTKCKLKEVEFFSFWHV